MGNRDNYGILHGDNLLVTYQQNDMYPLWGGHLLAKDAFDNRHNAFEIGTASPKCSVVQSQTGNGCLMGAGKECCRGPQPSDDIYRKERFHYCFHRPGVTQYPFTVESLWSPPTPNPSFSEMAYMQEVYPETPMSDEETDREFHYTWVTHPRNLFVASTAWPFPLRWQKGPRTAVFDLDSEDDVERLGRILVDGDAFDADVRP